MIDEKLLRRESERQQVARRLIQELDLLGRWRRYGSPALCGATSYGLLVAPDIDLEITGRPDARAGFTLAGEWASATPAIRRIQYLNALDTPDAGLGWEMTYRTEASDWKIQMWLLPPTYRGPRSTDLIAPMRECLTTRTRRIILAIKEALIASNVKYQAIDVYRAVLDDGISTISQFCSWASTNACAGMIDWQPRRLHSEASGSAT